MLLQRSFDADKFQAQLMESRSRPAWMDDLISKPRGRQLLCALAQQHPNALVLEMALKRIIKRGFIDEIAESGGALSGMLAVFHRCGNGAVILACPAAAFLAPESGNLCTVNRPSCGTGIQVPGAPAIGSPASRLSG